MRLYFFAILGWICLYAYTLHAQIGISASPMKLEFSAAGGVMQRQTVTLTNPSARTLEAGATFMDWQRDSAGNIIYYPAATQPHSCTKWMQLFPSTHFTLPPGASQEVTVTMNVPPGAADTASRHSMLLFTQLNMQEGRDARGMKVNITVRVGIQVYHLPPELQKKDVEITQFTDINASTQQKLEQNVKTPALLLTLKNTGQLPADGEVRIELTHLGSGQKTTLQPLLFYTLPGAIRQLNAPLDSGLSPGKYSAVALVDYGQDQELKVAELEFQYAAP